MRNIFTRFIPAVVPGLFLALAVQADTCIVSEPLDVSNFDIARHHNVNIEFMHFNAKIHAQLVTLSPNDRVIPELAESWDVDSEAKTITFTLSESCGWSDGMPITAEDVVRGLRALYRYDPPTFSGWQTIRGAEAIVEEGAAIETLAVEALDDRTVRIGVKADPSYAFYALTLPVFAPIPSHRPDNETLPLTSPDRVFSGPFHVIPQSGDMLTLKKNPHFCQPALAQADERHYLFTENQSQRLARFMAGDIDIVTDVAGDQADALIRQFPEDRKPRVMLGAAHRQANLMISPNKPALQDVEVRAALRDVLDMEALLRQGTSVEFDTRRVAHSVLHDVTTYENLPYPVLHPDREEALAHLQGLMAERGYSPEDPLQVTITTFPVAWFERTAGLIGSMLSQAYFDVELVRVDTVSDLISSVSERGKDLFLISWTLDFPHARNAWDGVYVYYQQLQLPDGSWRDFSPANAFLAGLSEAQSNIAHAQGGAELQQALREAERFLNEWHFILPIYRESSLALVSWHYDLEMAHRYWRRFGGCR